MAVLLTLKYVVEGEKITEKFAPEAQKEFDLIGSEAKNFIEV